MVHLRFLSDNELYMKISTTFIIGFLSVIFLIACQSSSNDAVRNEARRAIEETRPNTPPTPPASTITPAATTGAVTGVQHYICPNSCEGSGGPGAGTCPVCGSDYTHNQAYHAQQTSTTPSITTTPTTPGTTPSIIPPASTSAAQNAAGVYHYTCSNGCSGGAGSAVACSTCGTTLVHNTAYHQ